MICKNCGSQINAGQAYCNNCGSAVQTIVSNKSKKDNKKLIVIICSIVAVLLIIGLVIFLVTKNNDDNNYNGDNGIVDNENIENNNTNSDGELVLTENCSGDNKAVANITNGNIIIKRSGSLIDGEYNKEVVLDIGKVKSIASLTSLSCDMTDLMYIDTSNYLYRIKLVNLFGSNFDNKEIIKISESKVKGFGKNQPYGIEIIMENNDEHRIYSYNDCINETCGLNELWEYDNKNGLGVVIDNDNDLGLDYNGEKYFNLDSVDNIKKYADKIYDYVIYVHAGMDGSLSNIEKASDKDLGELMDAHLGRYVENYGASTCYEKEYFNDKLYEYYNRKVDNQSQIGYEKLTNYYCFLPGGGDSLVELVDEFSSVDNNEYTFDYKSEWGELTEEGKTVFNGDSYSMLTIKFEKQEDKFVLKSVIYKEG